MQPNLAPPYLLPSVTRNLKFPYERLLTFSRIDAQPINPKTQKVVEVVCNAFLDIWGLGSETADERQHISIVQEQGILRKAHQFTGLHLCSVVVVDGVSEVTMVEVVILIYSRIDVVSKIYQEVPSDARPNTVPCVLLDPPTPTPAKMLVSGR